MLVTDVRIRKVPNEGKMKAVVSVTFDDVFVVHDIKIIDGEKGLFIVMPSKKVGQDDYKDVAHPIKAEFREKLQKQILEAYNSLKDQEEAPGESNPEA